MKSRRVGAKDFGWSRQVSLDVRIEQIKKYLSKNEGGTKELRNYMTQMRKRKDKLNPETRKKFESIQGWVWNENMAKFMANVADFKQAYPEGGYVKDQNPGFPKLGQWGQQMRLYKKKFDDDKKNGTKTCPKDTGEKIKILDGWRKDSACTAPPAKRGSEVASPPAKRQATSATRATHSKAKAPETGRGMTARKKGTAPKEARAKGKAGRRKLNTGKS